MGTKRRRLAQRRKAVGYTQEQLAEQLGVERSTVIRWEAGGSAPQPWQWPNLADALKISAEQLSELLGDTATTPDELQIPEAASLSVLYQVELLRQDVNDTIGTSVMSDASLDDWEQTVLRHGTATRYRPAGAHLADLAIDFTELRRLLAQRKSWRRLNRITAHMAGLMFLTLIKLDESAAARNWVRTARLAADEAADPATTSWIRAQEAYVHYYSGNFIDAIALAHHAHALAGNVRCAGVPLAEALEARAHAALGRRSETRAAIARAETALADLGADASIRSAFGYDEAQLRFHQGNALTHLHDTHEAWEAQQRALALYPESDYLDRSLVRLDRASCLAQDGDVTAAMHYTTQTLLGLTDQQRDGLIAVRAREIFQALSTRQQALPASRECRDLLMLPTAQEKAED